MLSEVPVGVELKANSKFGSGGLSRIGLAFRTRPTAPTQAYTQTGAATKSQNDPIREQLPCGRAWMGATSRMAPRNGDSRASEISRAEHGALKSTDPFLARTRVSKPIGARGVKLEGRTPPKSAAQFHD